MLGSLRQGPLVVGQQGADLRVGRQECLWQICFGQRGPPGPYHAASVEHGTALLSSAWSSELSGLCWTPVHIHQT